MKSGTNAAPHEPPSALVQQAIAAAIGAVVSTLVTTVLASVSLSVLLFSVIAVAGMALLFSRWRQHLTLGIAAVAGIALGLGIGRMLNADPPPTPLPTAQSKPAVVRITAPDEEAPCESQRTPFCVFEVSGTVSGYDVNAHRLYIFMQPTNPPGAGWYPQLQPATVVGARWRQTPTQIGSEAAAAQAGHSIQLRAAIVRREATHDGTRLDAWPPGESLRSVEDIDGILALSDPVALTVRR